MDLEPSALQVFSEIYTQFPRSIDMKELEVKLGLSGYHLRPALETLKQAGLIIESEGLFEISSQGVTAARSMWA